MKVDLYTLGLDVGTSGTKAVVFDPDGRQVAEARRAYDVTFSGGGRAELDPEILGDAALATIREAALAAGAGQVKGIGISSQGEAFVGVDAEGRPLHPAMVSSDTRAAAYATSFAEAFGVDALYRITGHTAHPLFSLFKLLWLRDHEPGIWGRVHRFLCMEDFVHVRLGLDPAIGYSLAGRTMLFDVTRHVWSEKILEAVGLRAGQLARPLASGTVVGRLGTTLARELGLHPEAVVVAGGHDQPMGALGAGILEPGEAMLATGTVECITPAFPRPVFTEALRDGNLCTYDHAVPGLYATVAYSLTGGNLLKWFHDQFGQPEILAAQDEHQDPYTLLLETAGTEPSPLLALPYFTPSGTPHFDLETPGAILGLRLEHSRGQILRALLEGVALEMKLNLEILEASGCAVRHLRATGGGAKSRIWTQLKADVLNRPVTVMEVTEAACLGGAMLARAAENGEPVGDIATRWVRGTETIEPNPERADKYQVRFRQYRAMYSALRSVYRSEHFKGDTPCRFS